MNTHLVQVHVHHDQQQQQPQHQQPPSESDHVINVATSSPNQDPSTASARHVHVEMIPPTAWAENPIADQTNESATGDYETNVIEMQPVQMKSPEKLAETIKPPTSPSVTTNEDGSTTEAVSYDAPQFKLTRLQFFLFIVFDLLLPLGQFPLHLTALGTIFKNQICWLRQVGKQDIELQNGLTSSFYWDDPNLDLIPTLRGRYLGDTGIAYALSIELKALIALTFISTILILAYLICSCVFFRRLRREIQLVEAHDPNDEDTRVKRKWQFDLRQASMAKKLRWMGWYQNWELNSVGTTHGWWRWNSYQTYRFVGPFCAEAAIYCLTFVIYSFLGYTLSRAMLAKLFLGALSVARVGGSEIILITRKTFFTLFFCEYCQRERYRRHSKLYEYSRNIFTVIFFVNAFFWPIFLTYRPNSTTNISYAVFHIQPDPALEHAGPYVIGVNTTVPMWRIPGQIEMPGYESGQNHQHWWIGKNTKTAPYVDFQAYGYIQTIERDFIGYKVIGNVTNGACSPSTFNYEFPLCQVSLDTTLDSSSAQTNCRYNFTVPPTICNTVTTPTFTKNELIIAAQSICPH